MRRLFIILAKIVGIVLLYRWVLYFTSLLVLFTNISDLEMDDDGSVSLYIVGLIIYILLAVSGSYILILKTDWLADKLGVKDDDVFPSIANDVVLLSGFKLIGVYVFLNALPAVFTAVFRVGSYSMAGGLSKYIWTGALPAVIQIILSMFLLVRTESVLNFLKKGEKVHSKYIFSGTILVLALLVLVGSTIAKTKWGDLNKAFSARSDRGHRDSVVYSDHHVTSATQDWPTLQYKTAPTNSPWAETNKVYIKVDFEP